MAGNLKTFTTTSGFFDLAVAAPSMKAALDLWGAEFNLFTHGFARQTDERSTVVLRGKTRAGRGKRSGWTTRCGARASPAL